MRLTRLFVVPVIALATVLASIAATAQDQPLTVRVTGGRAAATPIAVVQMPYQGNGVAPSTDVDDVVRADFARTGQFVVMPETAMAARPTRGSELRYEDFPGQEYVLVGRIVDAPEGAYRIEYELFDVARRERVLGLAMPARANAVRDVAHQVADKVYEQITGVRGAFWTRILYVATSGTGAGMRYALMLADSDGFNPQSIVRSDKPLLSPAWAPDGRRVAYVSFERGNSQIVVQDITTGAREVVASFRGINGAPAFSPDGSKLAMALSRTGNLEVYVMDLGTRALTQVTNHFGIDTEPVWSADGTTLYFTSDRGGRPQIYKAPAGGGGATRVTFEGSYNATASVSPDGRKIAVAQGSGNSYRIALMDTTLGSAQWTTLTPGNLDESPTFAPNASMLLYTARTSSGTVLYTVSANRVVRDQLPVTGNVREAAWGPYRAPR